MRLKLLMRGAAVATTLFLASQASAGGMFREATIGEPPPLDVMLTTADVASTIGEHIFETLQPCLRAVELHRATYDGTFAQLAAHLEKSGIAPEAASALCEAWLIGGDFLLTIMNGGSPPNMKALQS